MKTTQVYPIYAITVNDSNNFFGKTTFYFETEKEALDFVKSTQLIPESRKQYVNIDKEYSYRDGKKVFLIKRDIEINENAAEVKIQRQKNMSEIQEIRLIQTDLKPYLMAHTNEVVTVQEETAYRQDLYHVYAEKREYKDAESRFPTKFIFYDGEKFWLVSQGAAIKFKRDLTRQQQIDRYADKIHFYNQEKERLSRASTPAVGKAWKGW